MQPLLLFPKKNSRTIRTREHLAHTAGTTARSAVSTTRNKLTRHRGRTPIQFPARRADLFLSPLSVTLRNPAPLQQALNGPSPQEAPYSLAVPCIAPPETPKKCHRSARQVPHFRVGKEPAHTAFQRLPASLQHVGLLDSMLLLMSSSST